MDFSGEFGGVVVGKVMGRIGGFRAGQSDLWLVRRWEGLGDLGPGSRTCGWMGLFEGGG